MYQVFTVFNIRSRRQWTVYCFWSYGSGI